MRICWQTTYQHVTLFCLKLTFIKDTTNCSGVWLPGHDCSFSYHFSSCEVVLNILLKKKRKKKKYSYLIVTFKELYVAARPLLVTGSYAARGTFLTSGNDLWATQWCSFRNLVYWVLNVTNLASQNYSTTHTTNTQQGRGGEKKKLFILIIDDGDQWREESNRIKVCLQTKQCNLLEFYLFEATAHSRQTQLSLQQTNTLFDS